MHTLDHLLWGGPVLDDATRWLHEHTGVMPAFGGQHPDLGTHNALAGLGRKTYLEVLAPDPALRHGALAHQLATFPAPSLFMWAARATDAAAVADRAEREGYRAVVVEGERVHPNGTHLRWTNVFVQNHGAGPLVPFFIQWHGTAHPAADAPAGLRLESFRAETRQPEALRAVLEALDVQLTVRRGTANRLVAVLDTPKGRVELAGASRS